MHLYVISTSEAKRRKVLENVTNRPLKTNTFVPYHLLFLLNALYKDLSNAGKPALLSIVPGYCDAYVASHASRKIPLCLSDLFQEDFLNVLY